MNSIYQKNETVVLWGDSLGKGVVWNTERNRHTYAQETAAKVAERELDIHIINRARFGYTAPQGLALIEARNIAEAMRAIVQA